ncbi:MAG TPA: SLBB domain-containing protein [Gemmatimonadaceae bacterium]|nr:SLBB domain-containing protein [Gemmatimonadaceae bacterium]
MTSEQVRARLRAAGYPESLLDAYLPEGASRPFPPIARDSLIDAVVKLGLVDSVTAHQLRTDVGRPDTSVIRGPSGRVDDLPIFGLDVFRRSTTRFEPTMTGGVGANYLIGPGDVLALIITGETEKAYSLDVSREGFILIPSVGQVYVANLTLAQAQTVLLARLRQSYSSISLSPGASTRFYVTISRIHTNQIFVIGEVLNPGSYQVSSVGTVLSALYAAGGPNDNGTLRRIQVQRSGQVVADVDLYDYLVRGDASHDARLETGDVVFVGVHGGRATVRGEVARPAVYEIVPGETLTQLISDAGGFTSEAARQRIQVRRILPPDQREPGGRDRVVLDVSPGNFAGSTPPFALLPGDKIEVFGIATRERNSISVAGSVWSPGTQGFKSGMRLSDALRSAGGVLPDVYLDEVLISRLNADGTRQSLHAELVDSLGTPRVDPTLQEDDSIRVYARSEFVPNRYVAIAGAVKRGGQYPYRAGMTLRELILAAGGPLESADLKEAEIARFPATRVAGQLATTFRVSLDSTYVLDRGLNGSHLGPSGTPIPASGAPEVLLSPYDNVLIFRQPEWRQLGTVWVGGEVKYPGAYTIRTTSERLSQILSRAGGLTPQADPNASVFFRRQDDAGRIGVDIGRALKDSKAQDNFVVLAGDSIFIGTYKPYVQVKGAVNSPVTVSYVRGRSVEYYVGAAGGLSHNADGSRVYVRQANGSVESRRRSWLRPDRDPTPGPGSTVFVPERDPSEKSDYAGVATVVAPILASLLTIITVIARR